MDCANQLRSSRTEYNLDTNPNICQFVAIRAIRGLCGIGVSGNILQLFFFSVCTVCSVCLFICLFVLYALFVCLFVYPFLLFVVKMNGSNQVSWQHESYKPCPLVINKQ